MAVRSALPTLAVLAAVLSVGCSASDRGPDVAAVADRFQSALESRDGEAACAQLSEQTASELEQQEQRPCEEAIVALELPAGGEVASTSVYVTSASAVVDEGGTLFLDEAADGWEISAAGCRPTAPDLPYDCELED
ncbi:MAG: hypothetical protein QOH58_3328 [Thermoleophilaceae bacterium]|jgi:hypothetical protein|nr:hypothetical protein [Thermoleophilaceae bacterium]